MRCLKHNKGLCSFNISPATNITIDTYEDAYDTDLYNLKANNEMPMMKRRYRNIRNYHSDYNSAPYEFSAYTFRIILLITFMQNICSKLMTEL